MAPCTYGHVQIWPVDLRKDSSVRHQWRQCEAEHWAFSFSTPTSNRQWVMSHAAQRTRSSSMSVMKLKSSFYARFLSALSFREQKTRVTSRHWGIRPNFWACVSLVSRQILQIYDAQKKEQPCFLNALAPPDGLWVCGEEQVCLIVSNP